MGAKPWLFSCLECVSAWSILYLLTPLTTKCFLLNPVMEVSTKGLVYPDLTSIATLKEREMVLCIVTTTFAWQPFAATKIGSSQQHWRHAWNVIHKAVHTWSCTKLYLKACWPHHRLANSLKRNQSGYGCSRLVFPEGTIFCWSAWSKHIFVIGSHIHHHFCTTSRQLKSIKLHLDLFHFEWLVP